MSSAHKFSDNLISIRRQQPFGRATLTLLPLTAPSRDDDDDDDDEADDDDDEDEGDNDDNDDSGDDTDPVEAWASDGEMPQLSKHFGAPLYLI